MRSSGGNPLDLNNFPEDYGGKHVFEESTTTTAASIDKKSGLKKKKKEGKDEKIYECRFCSLKFCKSQALGGHMNRHRQERENETLNRARQLVFSNDNITGVGAHIGLSDLSFGNNMQTTMPSSLHFGHVYPRISNPTDSSHHLHSNMYSSPSSLPFYQSPFPSSSPAAAERLPTTPPAPHHMSDYYNGRLPGSTSNYSCFSRSEGTISRSPNVTGREEGNTCISRNMDCGNWNVGNRSSFVHRTVDPSSFDRFRDGI